MATTTAHPGATRAGDRSPAQLYALVVGAVLVLAGIAGFAADSSFSTGSDINGDKLLGLEVSGIHNLVHIASGLLLLAGAGKPATARTVTMIFAAAYALVTLIGFIDGDTVLSLMPVNAADNVLHLVLMLAAIAVLAMDRTPQRSAAGQTMR